MEAGFQQCQALLIVLFAVCLLCVFVEKAGEVTAVAAESGYMRRSRRPAHLTYVFSGIAAPHRCLALKPTCVSTTTEAHASDGERR